METRIYTERSNARRAARSAGINPDAVFAVEGGFTFPEDTPPTPLTTAKDIDLDIPEFLKRPALTAEETAALQEKVRRSLSPDRVIVMPKSKAKTKSPTKPAGDKNAILLSMLKKGATVEDLTKALGWLPHTLRARISRLHKPKSQGGEGMKIERERKDGVTSYRIA